MKTLKLALSAMILSLLLLNVAVSADWRTIYETDFSADPSWTTNNETNHYWNGGEGTYFVDQYNINYGGEFAYYEAGYDGGSFLLEWDIVVDYQEYASCLIFGIFEDGLDTRSGDCAFLEITTADAGNVTCLYWWNPATENVDRVCEWGTNWSLGVWYRIRMEYNSYTGTLTADVSRRETGQLLFTLNAANVGPFSPAMGLVGNSNVRLNGPNFQVPESHTQGRFDNVRLLLEDKVCPPIYDYAGEVTGDQYGADVSDAGDVNNDGYDDFIVGAHFSDALGYYTGKAYVYSGFDGSQLHEFTGESDYDFFGTTVSTAGDVNGDGHDDLLIGASQATGTRAWGNGIAYVYSGADGSLLCKLHGEAWDDRFGMYDISDAGDVNNDGFGDFIVGANSNDEGGNLAGKAYVYSGHDCSLLYEFVGETGQCLGFSVSGAGDVDGDGYDDVFVGSAVWSAKGIARIYSGRDGSLLYAFTGEANGDLFGYSVSDAGDLNGDGLTDFVVGAYRHSTEGYYAGRAYVFYGQAGPFPIAISAGDADCILKGENTQDQFGICVSGAGDVNHDGFDDVAVGADGYDSWRGRAYIYSGVDCSLLHVLDGEGASAYDEFGLSLSDAGDVDGDGWPELIVGARADNNSGPGKAYVFSFAPSRVDGQVVASCSVPGTGLTGVTVDLFDDNGALCRSVVTDEYGDYVFENLPGSGDYVVGLVVPLGYEAEEEEIPVTVDCAGMVTVDFNLTCLETVCRPRGIGYWKHEVAVALGGVGKAELTAEQLCGFLDMIEGHFNSNEINQVVLYEPPATDDCVEKLAVASELMNLEGDVGLRIRAEQNLMALLFNIAAGNIFQQDIISEDGATVSQAITYCDNLIDDLAGDHNLVIQICNELNHGRMLEAGIIPLSTTNIAYKILPERLTLFQNYPNPFNPSTEISFSLPKGCEVKLEVFNIVGQKVTTLVDRFMAAGHHTVTWDGSGVASGVYLYRMQTDEFVQTKKMLLMK